MCNSNLEIRIAGSSGLPAINKSLQFVVQFDSFMGSGAAGNLRPTLYVHYAAYILN